MKALFLAIALVTASTSALAQTPQHTAHEAIAAATAEVKRRGIKLEDYWIELVRFEYKKSEWVVHFSNRQLILDTDITVILNDKTWKPCYIFGMAGMECA